MDRPMRVVVTGASGNVGTSVLRALADEPAVDSVVGVARRIPGIRFPKVEWRAADVARAPLEQVFAGADAVVHLAWLIQPGRDRQATWRVNVEGSRRVFHAAAAAGATSLVYASSVGAYAPGPKDRRVDEDWPTTGIPSSFYSRDKAEVERLLDRFEAQQPGVRVVRMRPGTDLQGRRGLRHPAPVRGSAAARVAPAPGADSPRPVHVAAGVPGRARARRGRGLPARRGGGRSRTVQPRGRARDRRRRASASCSGPAQCRCPRHFCGARLRSASGCVYSRRSPAGWTWRSACR